ncbi:MAG: Flagellar cap protein FliD, partial [uncultured Solirubrobacteraceae bacterium]
HHRLLGPPDRLGRRLRRGRRPAGSRRRLHLGSQERRVLARRRRQLAAVVRQRAERCRRRPQDHPQGHHHRSGEHQHRRGGGGHHGGQGQAQGVRQRLQRRDHRDARQARREERPQPADHHGRLQGPAVRRHRAVRDAVAPAHDDDRHGRRARGRHRRPAVGDRHLDRQGDARRDLQRRADRQAGHRQRGARRRAGQPDQGPGAVRRQRDARLRPEDRDADRFRGRHERRALPAAEDQRLRGAAGQGPHRRHRGAHHRAGEAPARAVHGDGEGARAVPEPGLLAGQPDRRHAAAV